MVPLSEWLVFNDLKFGCKLTNPLDHMIVYSFHGIIYDKMDTRFLLG
jgi:hypothetical protein